MSDVTDRDRFDFEREKWRADLEMRAREVAVKERDQASANWRNPLVVAIMAAAAAAAGNAIVAVVNGTQQVTLENSKAESTRILEMIKTGDADHAARNLDFLLESGLISDSQRMAKIKMFLAERKPGAGPALPSASGRVAFEPSSSLSEDLQKKLDKILQDYIAYLDRLGFPAGERVRVKIEQTSTPNAYYVDNMIVIDPKLSGDMSVALREYNHHILTSKLSEEWKDHFGAIESGVADYLACSFLDNPKLGAGAAKTLNLKTPYIRLLENNRKFGELGAIKDKAMTPYEGAGVWGGAFWAIRSALGRDAADSIISAAWIATKWPLEDAKKPQVFISALLAVARQKAPARADEVKSILQGRDFPVPR
jgi:hypothetical protein